ncbi:filamentous hemagglutinin N-terminal domain-containing protein [Anabaena sphaerica FACHB-251]|uniref:Filamentous hemagglutinin N-terminal domain-containing protein n=1 Tax=Anabaena sphaerica FACHB-251 TaxID=2692883 RepID=A0A927A2K2_9NOST|nr:filamentous hemagglutinin N-terminal domain-containing protein [Anabaena sphaerica]MBD2295478.1 filamentous hemagglutinin N-terminal domain-containing protein [Anabaena sphaerica FACHB-251]
MSFLIKILFTWSNEFAFFGIALLAVSRIIVGQTVVLAEIKPDTKLGNEASLVKQKVDIQGAIGDLIDGGAVRGTNLFHSFSEFNITEGQRVYFSNPSGIENILTRVTGKNRSDILGTLGVLGNANLFLINPNGIVFGQNAQLDIAGSFLASTADSFVFDHGFLFNAKNPQPVPLLTINVPLGLQYQSNSRSIQVQGTSILKPNGKTIALVGGNVSLDDAILSVPAGRVELGGISGEGIVEFSRDSDNLRLNFPESLTKADIFLNGTRINVIADNDGSVALNARNIAAINSFIFAGIGAGLGSATSKAGDIILNAAEEIKIDGISGILQYLFPEAVGTGGDIEITAKTLIATNGGAINNVTQGKGDAGNIRITAHDYIFLDGEDRDGFPTAVSTSITQGAKGNTGNISITTKALTLTNGASITSLVAGEGNTGNIMITAHDTISLDGENSSGGSSNISSQVEPGAIGNGGNIQITTGTLVAENGSQVLAVTADAGKAGNITIQARDDISFSGFSSNNAPSGTGSFSQATGAGGDVNISTRSLSIMNTAQVRTGAFAQGDSGNVTINAADDIFIDGDQSGVVSVVFSNATAAGGNINLITGKLAILNGAFINSATIGIGNAGNIQINADTITLDGSSPIGFGSEISAVTDNNAQGNAGNINIISNSLVLTNSAQINTSTNAKGKAGNITITTKDSVLIDGTNPFVQTFPSGIASLVRSNGEGKGGNIQISTDKLSLTNGGFLDASTFGQGNAGDIEITANDAVILNSGNNSNLVSDISSRVLSGAKGNGGEIDILAKTLLLINGSQIAADTFGQGNAGDITINTIDSVVVDGGNRTTNLTGIFTSVGNGGFGTGGDITIATGNLVVTNNNAQLNAATLGQGKAGNIQVTANTLQLANSGKLRTTTTSSEDGGDISLKISERITLAGDGTGLFANTTLDATGNSGNIFIDPKIIILRDGAKIAVDNQGSGTGGNIDIQAGTLTLDNRAVISAETASNTGGNIQLQLQDLLLLRRNSLISTTAGTAQAGGDGGNITINTAFIVAFPPENNDITANAFTGNGGSINITAQSMFGLTPRSRADLERLLGTNDPAQLNSVSLPTSDITAISQANPSLNGQVNLNILDTDPNNGLVALPTNVVDAAKLIAQTCRSAGGTTASQDSEFIVTGRGGLPANPSELLSSDAVWYDLQPYALLNEKLNSFQKEEKMLSQSPAAIVEAQGWVIGADGSVTLVAQAPTTTPQKSFVTPVHCPVVKN